MARDPQEPLRKPEAPELQAEAAEVLALAALNLENQKVGRGQNVQRQFTFEYEPGKLRLPVAYTGLLSTEQQPSNPRIIVYDEGVITGVGHAGKAPDPWLGPGGDGTVIESKTKMSVPKVAPMSLSVWRLHWRYVIELARLYDVERLRVANGTATSWFVNFPSSLYDTARA